MVVVQTVYQPVAYLKNIGVNLKSAERVDESQSRGVFKRLFDIVGLYLELRNEHPHRVDVQGWLHTTPAALDANPQCKLGSSETHYDIR